MRTEAAGVAMRKPAALAAVIALVVLLDGSSTVEARKVLTPNASTTVQTTTRAIDLGSIEYESADPGPDLTTSLAVGADGSLSAPGSSVTMIPDLCLAHQTYGGVYEFGYTNVGPCQPGGLVHLVVHELTGSIDPFSGDMSLNLIGHIQLSFAVRRTILNNTSSYSFSGDECTIGAPAGAGGGHLQLNLNTGESYGLFPRNSVWRDRGNGAAGRREPIRR